MNEERIKELWVEATGSIWPKPNKFTAGEYDHHLLKFAELVITESKVEKLKFKVGDSIVVDGDFDVGFIKGVVCIV